MRTPFYRFKCMLCCHTVNIEAYIDGITNEYRHELYEMLFFNQRLHILGSEVVPSSHILNDESLY